MLWKVSYIRCIHIVVKYKLLSSIPSTSSPHSIQPILRHLQPNTRHTFTRHILFTHRFLSEVFFVCVCGIDTHAMSQSTHGWRSLIKTSAPAFPLFNVALQLLAEMFLRYALYMMAHLTCCICRITRAMYRDKIESVWMSNDETKFLKQFVFVWYFLSLIEIWDAGWWHPPG